MWVLNFKHLERASVSWDSCSYQCKNDLTLPLLNRGKKWGKHSLVDSASRFRSSKKHVWQAQNLNYYWQILKRQLSLLCGILLQKLSTGGENLIGKTELHARLSHQACRWWHENETLQEVLCLLCFRLTCHTQLVNCASITSWRPTHAHVCAQEELLGWHFIKGSTEEVPAQNATVHSVYLNTGNIQEFLPRVIKPSNPKRSLCPGAPGVLNPTDTLDPQHSSLATARQSFAQLSWAELRAPEHTEPKVRIANCSFSCQGSPAPCSLGILAPQLPTVRMSCSSERTAGGTGMEHSPATEPPAQGNQ